MAVAAYVAVFGTGIAVAVDAIVGCAAADVLVLLAEHVQFVQQKFLPLRVSLQRQALVHGC